MYICRARERERERERGRDIMCIHVYDIHIVLGQGAGRFLVRRVEFLAWGTSRGHWDLCIHPVSVRRFPSFRTQPLENLKPLPMNKWISEQPSPWRKYYKWKSCYGDRVYSGQSIGTLHWGLCMLIFIMHWDPALGSLHTLSLHWSLCMLIFIMPWSLGSLHAQSCGGRQGASRQEHRHQ